MTDESRHSHPAQLSEPEAERVWRRAAELQAEAARLAELRARESHAETAEADDAEHGGYSLAEVRDAAVEAGIPAALVERALLEVEADRVADASRHRVPGAAERLLGETPNAVEVARILPGDREAVLAAMADLLPNAPYHLRLVEIVGPHPAEGGLLVFEMPGAQDLVSLGAGSFSSFSMAMQTADFKRFVFRLVPASDGTSTEVTVRSPLAYSRKLNTWVGGGIATAGGALAGIAGGAAGAALLGGLAIVGTAAFPALVAAAGLASAAGVAGLLVRGYRGIFRWALRKGENGLADLLRDLETRLRTAGAFSPAPRIPGQPEAEDPARALLALVSRRSAQ